MGQLSKRQEGVLSDLRLSLVDRKDSRSKAIIQLATAYQGQKRLSSGDIEILKLAIAQFFIERRKNKLKNKQRRFEYQQRRKIANSFGDLFFKATSKNIADGRASIPLIQSFLMALWEGDFGEYEAFCMTHMFDGYFDVSKSNKIVFSFSGFRYLLDGYWVESGVYKGTFALRFKFYSLVDGEWVLSYSAAFYTSGGYKTEHDLERFR